MKFDLETGGTDQDQRDRETWLQNFDTRCSYSHDLTIQSERADWGFAITVSATLVPATCLEEVVWELTHHAWPKVVQPSQSKWHLLQRHLSRK